MPGAAVMAAVPAAAGFFGKIPARGDFVRAGLPRGFVDPWDEWLQRVIAGSRAVLGPRWLAAWMEAPIWHFALPEGQCGPAPVLGLWMPSVDAAGRHFPLTLARVGTLPADPERWLAAAEAIGLDALQDDLAPEEIARRLAALPDDAGARPAPSMAQWWSDGSPFVAAARHALCELPDAAAFAAMLHDMPDCDAADQPNCPPGAGGVREP
ncbi:MAG: type VI secretion system-associated protein TagF [Acetobacteraceae bacterium]|nr:type VI secretion system-associated protein TagF [Acetobacteraceae bacterium]